MTKRGLKKLNIPDAPGVYAFRDARKRPLYIGRATSLRDRLKSYFANDLAEARGPRIADMVARAGSATWRRADSVLEAVIMESALIKRYQPAYNVDDRDDKSDQYVVITAESWPRVFTARARDFDAMKRLDRLPYKPDKVFGPFVHSGLIEEALKIMRRLFPFRDKKAIEPRHERFYRAMGRSPEGGGEDSRREYLKTIGYLKLFFRGMKPAVKRRIESDMKSAARSLRFEEANRLKKLLRALDHIDDTALIKRDDGKKGNGNEGLRIEAYDVAHLSGTNVVGVMVAVVGGAPAKGEYRKFKISRQANDDAAGLAEILSRRLNHPEWPYPDLIVVDGNDIQLRAAEAVLKARRMSVPVVAVTKDRNHKASKLVGDGLLAGRRKADIIAANAEAHRFALDFHRKRRNLAFRPGRRDILQSWRKA